LQLQLLLLLLPLLLLQSRLSSLQFLVHMIQRMYWQITKRRMWIGYKCRK
jgi:hypothetical protein